MWHDGMKFHRVRHLGWRYGNPETDIDRDGMPVSGHYCVIVKVSDCPVKDGFYHTKGVKAHVQLSYWSNNIGSGKKRESKRWGYTIPIYLVYDGAVYMATTRGKNEN